MDNIQGGGQQGSVKGSQSSLTWYSSERCNIIAEWYFVRLAISILAAQRTFATNSLITWKLDRKFRKFLHKSGGP